LANQCDAREPDFSATTRSGVRCHGYVMSTEAVVYVEYSDEVLYYQSNFRSLDSRGKPMPYPTKLIGGVTRSKTISLAKAKAAQREELIRKGGPSL